MVNRGVPDVPAAVAGQQQYASVPNYLDELRASGHLSQALGGYNLKMDIAASSNMLSASPHGMAAQTANIGPYSTYEQAINTAGLFVNPQFQQQVAGGVAQTEFASIQGGAMHYQENTGLDYHSALAASYHDRMRNAATGGVGPGIGMRGALGEGYANTSDPDRYVQEHIFNTALEDIHASTSHIRGHFEALPSSMRREATNNIRTTTLGELGAAQSTYNVTKQLEAKGVDPSPGLSFNNVIDAMGADPSYDNLNINNQVIANPMAADPFKAVMGKAEHANLNRISTLGDTTAGAAHMNAGGSHIDMTPEGSLGGDAMGSGSGSGSGSGGNNELIKALRDLTGVINRATGGGGGHAGGGGGGGTGGTGGGGTGGTGGGGPLAIAGPKNQAVTTPGDPIGNFGATIQKRQRGGFWDRASGFLSGLTGGQGTEDDSDPRRKWKWAGRAVAAGAGAVAGALGASSIGDDLMPMLSSVPGFGRGFEGIGTLDKFVQTAAAGELPALQASGALGLKGASGTFMNKQMGGNMGAGADFGISAEKMGGLFFPMASAAGGGMGAGDVGKFTRAYAGGEDVQGVAGLIGQQRQAGFRGNRAAEFNAAKAQGLTGSAATGYASQLFGAFRGLSSGSGIGMDRLGTEGRILGMGKGDIAAGSARFQRGMGVHEGARQALFAPFQGIASDLLMAEALQRSGGDFLLAQKLIEEDKAQGGSMAQKRLKDMQLTSEQAQLVLGDRLTSEDMEMMGAKKGVKGGKSFEFNEAKKGNATFLSSALAERRNEQIDTALSESGRSMFTEIQKQEKIVEAKLITNLEGTIGALGATTASVLALNDTINSLAKIPRDVLMAAGTGGIGKTALMTYLVAMGLLGIK
jgi:hypothetical protein